MARESLSSSEVNLCINSHNNAISILIIITYQSGGEKESITNVYLHEQKTDQVLTPKKNTKRIW